MRFNVDRICELAGLGSASGSLISEAAVPAEKAPAKPAPVAAAKAPAKSAAPAKAPAVKEDAEEEEEEEGKVALDEYYDEFDQDTAADSPKLDEEEAIAADEMYEIEETDLMEALVEMRQARLEEEAVRDAVREEIARALSDKSGSWVYGSKRPTASRQGQIARGGFGVGFGFKR